MVVRARSRRELNRKSGKAKHGSGSDCALETEQQKADRVNHGGANCCKHEGQQNEAGQGSCTRSCA